MSVTAATAPHVLSLSYRCQRNLVRQCRCLRLARAGNLFPSAFLWEFPVAVENSLPLFFRLLKTKLKSRRMSAECEMCLPMACVERRWRLHRRCLRRPRGSAEKAIMRI